MKDGERELSHPTILDRCKDIDNGSNSDSDSNSDASHKVRKDARFVQSCLEFHRVSLFTPFKHCLLLRTVCMFGMLIQAFQEQSRSPSDEDVDGEHQTKRRRVNSLMQ